MFIKKQHLLIIPWFFLFQWIWGSSNPVYALETSRNDCEVSESQKWQSGETPPL